MQRVSAAKLLNGKRVKDFVGRREIILFIGAAIITQIFSSISYQLPVNIMPNLALCPVIGLLFGPFASLGVNLVSLIDNVYMGYSPLYCCLNLLTMFLTSYIPYRLWYSVGLDRDDRPPVLDSVRNITKFVVMMVVSSLVYTVLYNITYGLTDGQFILNFEDVVRFINVLSFSFLFGLAAILLLRYLGIKFYSPKFGGTPDDFRRSVDPRFYDMILVLGILLPLLVLNLSPTGPAIPAIGVLTYALLFAFLLKPVESASMDELTVRIKGLEINKFNRSLIERMIVIFIIYGLLICIAFGAAASIGILNDVFGWGYDITVLFYMSMGLLVFFVPAMIFLWYLEKYVTDPVGELSEASRNFISSDHEFSSEEFEYSCRDLVNQDSEIGELARSLTKMTGDIEEYVEDLRMLNSQQEMYRAELNVAKNIQESFVPTNFSIVDGSGASVAAVMDAAKYVGGDFYDFFMIDSDHLAISIGDVSGKGVPAALFMAVTKSLIEGQSRPGFTPDEIFSKVNIGLCRNNEEFMFVTSWLGILELETGRLTYCSAGHNPPVLIRLDQDPVLLTTKQCLVLGAREGIAYTSDEIVMEPGDRILLYTDGVTEANDHFDSFYQTDRLMAKMKECDGMPLDDQIRAIIDDISAFTKGATQFDDMTMLMMRYDGKRKSGQALLDREDVASSVAPVADPVDVPLDKEYA